MSSPRTLRIGVTGGIGSGKSTVCKVFSILGIPIYAADEQAKRLMAKEEGLKKKILSTFGPNAYSVEGELNRKFLASTVFFRPREACKSECTGTSCSSC